MRVYFLFLFFFANSILKNRDSFNKLRGSLTRDQIILLMYSVNPASRLTAIEEYIRNKNRFPISKEINAWIEKVYSEVPMIETMSGCIGYPGNSKNLVLRFAKMKNSPE